MAIKVLEIHRTGFRIDAEAQKMKMLEQFYTGVLGLDHDAGQPDIPGIPGMWINVDGVAQVHLFGGTQTSPAAKGRG
jgi:hypothetical protein